MDLIKTILERFGLQKPAAKASLVVIIILAQCCVCILPFMVMSLSSGAEMVESSPAVAAEVVVDMRPGFSPCIEGMLERGFESARQMVAVSLSQP